MAITYAQAQKILNGNFGKNPETLSDSTYYIGLSSSNPGNEGTNVTEPVSNGYVRIEVPNNSTYWNQATLLGVSTNAQPIVFGPSTGSWGTISYVFVANNAVNTGSSVLYYEAISPITVEMNTTIQFAANSFSITMINT